MKKIFVLSFMVLTSFLMVKCSSSKKTATTAPNTTASSTTNVAIAEKVDELKKQFSEDQLQQGKTIFESKCHKCHGLKRPETHTFSKYSKVLPSMIKKARLSDEEGNLVRAYLLTNAKQS